MVKKCPRCGHENPDDAYFCEFCHYPLISTSQGGQPSTPPPTPSEFRISKEPQEVSSSEVKGLDYLRRFSLFYVISMFFIGIGSSAFVINSVIGGLIALVGAIIGIYSILLVRLGYSKLSEVSNEFKSPALGSLLIVVGLILTIIAEGVGFYIILSNPTLLNQLESFLTTGALPPITSAMLDLAYVGLIYLIAIILSIVGIFLSLVLGPFRLEKRYGGMFRVAGWLFLFGFLLSFFGLINSYVGFAGFLLTLIASLIFLNNLNVVIYKIKGMRK